MKLSGPVVLLHFDTVSLSLLHSVQHFPPLTLVQGTLRFSNCISSAMRPSCGFIADPFNIKQTCIFWVEREKRGPLRCRNITSHVVYASFTYGYYCSFFSKWSLTLEKQSVILNSDSTMPSWKPAAAVSYILSSVTKRRSNKPPKASHLSVYRINIAIYHWYQIGRCQLSLSI